MSNNWFVYTTGKGRLYKDDKQTKWVRIFTAGWATKIYNDIVRKKPSFK